MIKTIKNLLLLFVAFTLVTLVACSEDDDGPDGDVSGDLVGTWTGGSATINAFTINGEDISSFLDQIKQGLIQAGFAEADAEAFIQEFEDLISEGYTESFEGSITFNDNGTYESTDTSGSDIGTWSLSSDKRTLVMDAGTDDELEISVVNLTNSLFEGLIEFEEVEDLDEDGTDDTIAVSITITFTR